MSEEIKVGIGDMDIVESPSIIMTVGLGSCIGITIYDSVKKIIGLSHIMLPDSTQFNTVTNPMKFADLAIPILIDKMIQKGCSRYNMTAKIVGGASMFKFSDSKLSSNIGERNAQMVRYILKEKENIPIIAEQVGGNKGRTMIARAEDGSVVVKVIGQELFTI